MTQEQIKERLEELVEGWEVSMQVDKNKLAMLDSGHSGINRAFVEGCFFQTYMCKQDLINIIKGL